MEPQKMEKIKYWNMKLLRITKALILTFALSAFQPIANAQNSQNQEGVVVYSLPSTSLVLQVETIKEVYTPGPYAKYAGKYLGIDVPQQSEERYQLSSIKLTPALEADMSQRYVANISTLSSQSAATFFKMTSQGVVVLSDSQKGSENLWRFPTLTDNFDNNPAAATPSFTSTETTLYKNVKNSNGGFDRVSIQQNQVVEKSVEKKAQEIAAQIFSLRKKRVDIITGDTDATFSGEALGAAIDEITRLEEEFMSLFLGKTQSSTQSLSFNVVPKAENERQLYIAFRLSDNQGLMPADDVLGRPIILELTQEEIAKPSQTVQGSISKNNKKINIFYRVPSICLVKVLDGQHTLLQTRIPIYQLGETLSFPLETLIK